MEQKVVLNDFYYILKKEFLNVDDYGVNLNTFTCEEEIFKIDKDDNIWDINNWGYYKIIETNNPKYV